MQKLEMNINCILNCSSTISGNYELAIDVDGSKEANEIVTALNAHDELMNTALIVSRFVDGYFAKKPSGIELEKMLLALQENATNSMQKAAVL